MQELIVRKTPDGKFPAGMEYTAKLRTTTDKSVGSIGAYGDSPDAAIASLKRDPRYDGCCEECFSVSHDTNSGYGNVAIPDGCKDEDCECHEQVCETSNSPIVTAAKKLTVKLACLLLAWIAAMMFMTPILAVPEDIDRLWAVFGGLVR